MNIPFATREEALQQMQDFGLMVNHIDIDTPNIRRCKIGQKRNLNGFYRAWSQIGTNLITGFYGSYTPTYQMVKFTSNREAPKFTEAEQFQIKKKIEESKAIVKEEFEPDLTLWDIAEDATEHPYLSNKSVQAYGLKTFKGAYGLELLIPIRDINENLVGIQRIMENGKKLIVKGSKKKGGFHKIEGGEVIAICEGYSTGATIHEATGWTVLVCFDCGNMRNVARYFRTDPLIVCADDDYHNEENAGVLKAKEVASKYFCPVAIPKFDDPDNRGTDFNDLGIQKTAQQLLGKAPKSFLDQLLDLEDTDSRENLIIDRRELLAQYPKHLFAKLKNDIKVKCDIAKGFLDDAISGIVSDEQIQAMEDAEEELLNVRYDGKSYYKLALSHEGDKYYSTSQQEVTLLVNLASGDDTAKKQKFLDEIHKNRVVSEVSAQPMPIGRSHIKEYLAPDGTSIIKKMVSTEKCIQSRLAELDDVAIDESFIQYILDNYQEVVDIMEASLSRKFCESKKAFVYLKCPTHYGKTFFFGLDSLGRSFTKKYSKDEFRGNSPDDFIKPLYLFIDEADCFPSEYKSNEPEYKRLYGGFAKVKLGLRIMACANSVEDVERGVDPQIQERVVCIEPKGTRLDHCGIEKNASRLMFEKWILNRLGNLLLAWSQEGDILKSCENHFNTFLNKYDNKKEFISLGDVLKEHLEELLTLDTTSLKTQFDFTGHIHKIAKGKILITSPMKFFKELFKYLDENRVKAFFGQYKKVEEVTKLPFLSEVQVVKIGKVTKRGVEINYTQGKEGLKLQDYDVTTTKNNGIL